MKCIKCKETYDDEFKFCPYCGEEKPAPKICPNCKLEPNVEFSYCPECGEKLNNKKEYEEEPEKIEIEEHLKNEHRKKEEKLARLKKESKEIEFKNIVEDEKFVEEDLNEEKYRELNSKYKSQLNSKIDRNIIRTESELRIEIKLIKEKEHIKNEKRKLKLKNSLSKMSSEWIIDDDIREKLIHKINENEIRTEDDLHERMLYYFQLKEKRHGFLYSDD